MLGFYLFLFGGIIVMSGFLTPPVPPTSAGSPTRRCRSVHTPSAGADLWIMGFAIGGIGTILSGVNFITTIVTMRAPGMTMFRMSVFTWTILLTSVLVLVAFPVLAACVVVLETDRKVRHRSVRGQNGGAILWQHLFWFFGHPEVYILALPFFG